jgi:hypothetical protein
MMEFSRLRGSLWCDIAPLHFAYDPMQQTGADPFVLAKLRRHVPK